ncbi:MAG: DUF983 domain-containing protein [Gemmatimonadetes bacterium]|nr:DUF983 domain-containing protein [Gemmatimonadota bacterium]
MTDASPTSGITRLLRAFHLRCPACGARGILAHWLQLAPRCPSCGLRPDRGEPDHFLGAYVISLGAAETVAVLLWLVLLALSWPDPSWTFMQWSAAALVVLTPVALYPFTRLLFLAIDLTAQPRRPGDFGDDEDVYR